MIEEFKLGDIVVYRGTKAVVTGIAHYLNHVPAYQINDLETDQHIGWLDDGSELTLAE